MFLLLDECCARSLVAIAEAAGHTAQRSVEVAELGRGALDPAIFEWARREGTILATSTPATSSPWPAAGGGILACC